MRSSSKSEATPVAIALTPWPRPWSRQAPPSNRQPWLLRHSCCDGEFGRPSACLCRFSSSHHAILDTIGTLAWTMHFAKNSTCCQRLLWTRCVTSWLGHLRSPTNAANVNPSHTVALSSSVKGCPRTWETPAPKGPATCASSVLGNPSTEHARPRTWETPAPNRQDPKTSVSGNTEPVHATGRAEMATER